MRRRPRPTRGLSRQERERKKEDYFIVDKSLELIS